MPELMRSPITALIWEIWARSRGSIWIVIAITSFTCLFNSILPESYRAAEGAIGMLNFHLGAASLLLVLSIFSYTEFNSQKGSNGYPHRLFALPVTSFQLVAVPMFFGLFAVELVCLAWVEFVFAPGELTGWLALLVGTYMVLYQTILWTLPDLGPLRILLLGLIAVSFIMLPAFPLPLWLSKGSLVALFIGLSVVAFITSWIYVARQRSGGGSAHHWLKPAVDRIRDTLPGRKKAFGSAAEAQLWFEWRRSGLVLPLLTAGLLGLVVVPLSWKARTDAASTLRILVTTLAMPIVLALPVGKAFSKPDFWSADLSIPQFVAVRPLSTSEMVTIKMKAAAVSTAASWFLVLAFIFVWLPFWADLAWFTAVRVLSAIIVSAIVGMLPFLGNQRANSAWARDSSMG
jgi:hypothetical protein